MGVLMAAAPALAFTDPVQNQSVSGETVTAGGVQNVLTGGVVSDTRVYGEQQVLTGGLSYDTTVESGGIQYVNETGRAIGTVVNAGGTQFVSDSASANRSILNGGTMVASSSILVENTEINNGGVLEAVGSAGVHNTVVNDGGQLKLMGATSKSNNAVINTGGSEDISAGAISVASEIKGGVQTIEAGGQSDRFVLNSGEQVVRGDATQGTINNGTSVVESGGVMARPVVNGGAVHIQSNGLVEAAVINDSAALYLENGALVTGQNQIKSGAAVRLVSEGTPYSVTKYGSTTEIILDNGTIETTGTDGVYTANMVVNPPVRGNGTIAVRGNTAAAVAGTDYDSITFNDIQGNYKVDYVSTNSGAQHPERIAGVITDVKNTAAYTSNVELGAYVYSAENNGGVIDLVRDSAQMSSSVQSPVLAAAVSLGAMISLSEAMSARLGDLTYMAETSRFDSNVWASYIRKNIEVHGYKADFNGVEGGFDFVVYQDRFYKAFIGILAHFSKASPDYGIGLGKTDVDIEAKGLGVYAMWASRSGWFADAVVRAFKYDQDIINKSGGNARSYDLAQNALTLNVEAGKRIAYPLSNGMNRRDLFITPRFEFAAAWVKGDDATDSGGGVVNVKDASVYRGIFDTTLGYRHDFTSNFGVEPYIKAGVLYDFNSDAEASYNRVSLTEDIDGFKYAVGAGLKLKIYNALTGQVDFTYMDGSDYKNTSINAGLRLTF
jgi:outer membrane autotransporter protein